MTDGQTQLNEQVALLLGWTSATITTLPGKPLVQWRAPLRYYAEGAIYTMFGNLPDFTRNANWLPVLLVEVQRRGKRDEYVEALLQMFNPDEHYKLYSSALETTHPSAHVPDLLWSLLGATPEQHCRAFVKVCSDAP